MKYTITVNESANGKLSVVGVQADVAVNQYRTDKKRLPNSTFTVSSASRAATAKRAVKSR